MSVGVGDGTAVTENVVDRYIAYLRRKLGGLRR